MKAVIYARYSSDSQREEYIEGSSVNVRSMPKETASPSSAVTSTEPCPPELRTGRNFKT